jgi:large subunit ribosomal protein L20
MSRVKKGFKARRRRNRILKQAKGYRGSRSKLWRSAVGQVRNSWQYQYRDRKNRKREFRQLWITRIAAAARLIGLSYSRLMGGLKKAGIEIDRKVLSDLAIFDPQAFGKVAELAKATWA